MQGLQKGASPTTAYIKTLRRDIGMENVRDLVALDTNITKNRLDMFLEIPNFFSTYLEKVLKISKIFGFISQIVQ